MKQGSLSSQLILLTLHWTSFMLPATREIDCDNNAKRKTRWAEVIKERVTFLQSLQITVIGTVTLQGIGTQESPV